MGLRLSILVLFGGRKLTYERLFYRLIQRGRNKGKIYGFPMVKGAWCNSELKVSALDSIAKVNNGKHIIQYLGIAADEPERIKRHTVPGKCLPLVDIGWDEAYCRRWCEENNLLSPIYTTAQRGGCWFCHNQSVDQLRLLRRNYPELWSLLLKWDLDSPICFRPDGHTVHDFDKRFAMEESGEIPTNRKFRWKMLQTKE